MEGSLLTLVHATKPLSWTNADPAQLRQPGGTGKVTMGAIVSRSRTLMFDGVRISSCLGA